MIRRALEWFGGSVLVYVLVAACSSTSGGGGQPVSMGEGGDGSGGVQGNGGEGVQGGRDGGIMNPVPDAMAAAGAGNDGDGSCECPDPYVPPKPTVVEAECDIEGPSGVMFAEAEFPGKTADELASTTALVEFPHDIASKVPTGAPDGYAAQSANVFVRDGFVATNCGASGNDHVATRVVFTLP
jgi:hypothetical protein